MYYTKNFGTYYFLIKFIVIVFIINLNLYAQKEKNEDNLKAKTNQLNLNKEVEITTKKKDYNVNDLREKIDITNQYTNSIDITSPIISPIKINSFNSPSTSSFDNQFTLAINNNLGILSELSIDGIHRQIFYEIFGELLHQDHVRNNFFNDQSTRINNSEQTFFNINLGLGYIGKYYNFGFDLSYAHKNEGLQQIFNDNDSLSVKDVNSLGRNIPFSVYFEYERDDHKIDIKSQNSFSELSIDQGVYNQRYNVTRNLIAYSFAKNKNKLITQFEYTYYHRNINRLVANERNNLSSGIQDAHSGLLLFNRSLEFKKLIFNLGGLINIFTQESQTINLFLSPILEMIYKNNFFYNRLVIRELIEKIDLTSDIIKQKYVEPYEPIVDNKIIYLGDEILLDYQNKVSFNFGLFARYYRTLRTLYISSHELYTYFDQSNLWDAYLDMHLKIEPSDIFSWKLNYIYLFFNAPNVSKAKHVFKNNMAIHLFFGLTFGIDFLFKINQKIQTHNETLRNIVDQYYLDFYISQKIGFYGKIIFSIENILGRNHQILNSQRIDGRLLKLSTSVYF